MLHFAEFGVIMLLFVIGLELRPKSCGPCAPSIFGLGSAQVALTGLVLAAVAMAFGLVWQAALFAGLALSLSSTAFALQILEEKDELALRHGRLAFSVLLFQDLAAIPLIALAPLFAVAVGAAASPWRRIGRQGHRRHLAVVIVGRYLLNGMYRLVARTRVKEAMTASALLTVVGVTLVMQVAGLPASLGAFIAGVLLPIPITVTRSSPTSPRSKGCCSACSSPPSACRSISLIAQEPHLVLPSSSAWWRSRPPSCSSGRRGGLNSGPARRLALALSQGGEFAFALFAAGTTAGVLDGRLQICFPSPSPSPWPRRPCCCCSTSCWRPRPSRRARSTSMPDNDGHVVIAGFGRVGQIVARILSAKRIPVTALDSNPEQVDFVRKFGAQIFYGDASRPEILEAAQTGKARAFVLAIDDIEASLRTARVVRRNYPDVPIYARARTRRHVHQLMDEGIKIIRRETFLASVDLTREVLRGLGLPEREVQFTVDTFQAMDRRRLYEDYKHYTDIEKLQSGARSYAQELEELFAKDAAERAKADAERTSS